MIAGSILSDQTYREQKDHYKIQDPQPTHQPGKELEWEIATRLSRTDWIASLKQAEVQNRAKNSKRHN